MRVTVLCPGPVPTEFQARAGVTQSTFPRLLAIRPDGWRRRAIAACRRAARVVVPGGANKVVTLARRGFVPRRPAAG